VVDQLIADNPALWQQAQKNPRLLGWFVGQAMRARNGNADPNVVQAMFRARAEH
jgi:aspartyl-tRNA(Asn)/glutamyl-tRNA(Gln) amidotransferase subunit B